MVSVSPSANENTLGHHEKMPFYFVVRSRRNLNSRRLGVNAFGRSSNVVDDPDEIVGRSKDKICSEEFSKDKHY